MPNGKNPGLKTPGANIGLGVMRIAAKSSQPFHQIGEQTRE
jgi:hypothetical protein